MDPVKTETGIMATLSINPAEIENEEELRAQANRRNVARASSELVRRLRWRTDYVAWCRERLHLPDIEMLDAPIWSKQDEIWKSVRDNRKTHVKSGHKNGKTKIAALITLWFLDCWRPSRVVTTSASFADVKMKLWGHIRDLYRNGGEWFGPSINMTDLLISDRHYALGLSCDRVEAFAGHNEEFVLVVIDEASAISQELIDAAEAQATRILELGNPLMSEGPFYDHSKSDEYHHITISCWDHPNVVFNRMIIPGGPTREWCESRLKYWKIDSPLYLTRVLGEFVTNADNPWQIYPRSWVEAAMARWVPTPPEDSQLNAVGCDVARGGDDKTTLCKRFGKWYSPVEKHPGKSTPDGPHVAALCKVAVGDTRVKVNIDVVAVGSSPYDACKANDINAVPLNGSNKSSATDHTGKIKFKNKRAEWHWKLREMLDPEFGDDIMLPPDPELLEEMIQPRWKLTVSGIQVEQKEEIKERLKRSPDIFEAVLYASASEGGWMEYFEQVIAAGKRESAESQKAS
jgi:hypothetical protein